MKKWSLRKTKIKKSVIDKNVQRMREASGKIDDSRLLVGFLYYLMRDLVPPGEIEKIMLELSNAHDYDKSEYSDFQFTNGWLATYCKDIAERLLTNKKTKPGPLK